MSREEVRMVFIQEFLTEKSDANKVSNLQSCG